MDLGVVDLITTDAVGEPGMRTFYLQARAGGDLVTVVVEKEQVVLLAQLVLEILADLPVETGAAANPPELEDPVDPLFRAGRLSIGYDPDEDRFLLEITEFEPEIEDEDEDEARRLVPRSRASPRASGCGRAGSRCSRCRATGPRSPSAADPPAASAATRSIPKGTCVRRRTAIGLREPDPPRPRGGSDRAARAAPERLERRLPRALPCRGR